MPSSYYLVNLRTVVPVPVLALMPKSGLPLVHRADLRLPARDPAVASKLRAALCGAGLSRIRE